MLSSALEHFLGHKVTTTSVVVGALVGAIAFSFGLYCGGGAEGNVKPSKTKTKLAATTPTGVNERYKMVLCVRMDLKMGKGKVAAQCCHATLGVFKKLWRRRDPVLRLWEDCGQPKVTLQVPDEESMLELYQRAKESNVCTYIVVDAGRTQVAPNSRTVMAIGPAIEEHVNKITGHLKLL